jgi:alkylhydroperoxidase family enzyme
MTEPRLPPLQYSDFTDQHVAAVLGGLPANGIRNVFPEGKPPQVPTSMAALLHHVPLGADWLAMNKTLIYDSALGHRRRELLVLRVGWRARCWYEWYHHCRWAEPMGISRDETLAISRGDFDVFDDLESAMLHAADELIDGQRIEDATWKRLAAVLTPAELQELVMTVGIYMTLALIFNSFDVHVEPEWSGFDAPPFPLANEETP